MEKKGEIAKYRERLDKSLVTPALTNEETLKILVKNQLANSTQNEHEGCIDNIVEKRTSEVSNFLDMLRSASVNDHELSKSTEAATHGEWKLKEDNEEFRVMYREGPQGTPFHTLLVEGYVDGPVDVCLCISWESEFYKKWWPQTNIPPFKIAISKCLQRVQIGEQISLVRVKLMWPISTREAVVHFYTFQYLQDDIIIALMNTIPDLQSIDKSTHGYTIDEIPEAKDVVRIDLVGGFVIQKVTPNRSYFRTIATMDIKLDFVPPSLINFISRQLIGNGFRLYKKSVKFVSNSAEDYSRALRDPLYTRIREALYSIDKPDGILPVEGIPDDLKNTEQDEIKFMPEDAEVTVKKDICEMKEEPIEKSGLTNKEEGNLELEIICDDVSDDSPTELSPKNAQTVTKNASSEIEEEDSEECVQIDSRTPLVNAMHHNIEARKKVIVRPEVKHALGILDKVISILREYELNGKQRSSNGEHPASIDSKTKETTSLEKKKVCSNGELSKKDGTIERTSHDFRNSFGARDSRDTRSSSYSREGNHNRIAPASPEGYFSIPIDTNQMYLCSSKNWTKEEAVPHHSNNNDKQISVDSNNIHEVKKYPHKKFKLCCFFSSEL